MPSTVVSHWPLGGGANNLCSCGSPRTRRRKCASGSILVAIRTASYATRRRTTRQAGVPPRHIAAPACRATTSKTEQTTRGKPRSSTSTRTHAQAPPLRLFSNTRPSHSPAKTDQKRGVWGDKRQIKGGGRPLARTVPDCRGRSGVTSRSKQAQDISPGFATHKLGTTQPTQPHANSTGHHA